MACILVIEDEHETRVALRQMLKRSGYEVLEASDGEAGLEVCSREPVNLVITDILMPGKEGLETIRELRQDFPDVRIIAISGSGYRYLQMAEEFGAHRTFSKPFQWPKILEAVVELLNA